MIRYRNQVYVSLEELESARDIGDLDIILECLHFDAGKANDIQPTPVEYKDFIKHSPGAMSYLKEIEAKLDQLSQSITSVDRSR